MIDKTNLMISVGKAKRHMTVIVVPSAPANAAYYSVDVMQSKEGSDELTTMTLATCTNFDMAVCEAQIIARMLSKACK